MDALGVLGWVQGVFSNFHPPPPQPQGEEAAGGGGGGAGGEGGHSGGGEVQENCNTKKVFLLLQ